MTTLFAHLATRFAASPENIAIEALGFVLAGSAAARSAFGGLIALGSPLPLPTDLTFATQAGIGADDTARPDIEVYGPDLQRCCVMECKFWAGLTANQPVSYAQRLLAERPGSLAFIVPAARMTALWGELTKRLGADGYSVTRRRAKEAEVWYASFRRGEPRHAFVLASWRSVLAAIDQSMTTAGESLRRDDLRQLAGLCERMDADAFLPLSSEEVTSLESPKRYLQLAQLAFDIGTALVEAGVAQTRTATTKLTAASGPGFHGRYLFARGAVFFLAFDCALWATAQTSPVWIRIDAQRFPHVAASLKQNAERVLGSQAVTERNQSVALAAPLRHGVERHAVVDAAVSFSTRATALLAAEPVREQGAAGDHGAALQAATAAQGAGPGADAPRGGTT